MNNRHKWKNEQFRALLWKASIGYNDSWSQVDPEVLEKFAELIVVDCLIEIERLGIRNGDTEHNRALNSAWKAISEKFGVTKT
jgi:hypothetical protein